MIIESGRTIWAQALPPSELGYTLAVQQDLAILTPEKSILTFRLAGLGARAGAHLIDIGIIVASIVGAAIGTSLASSVIGGAIASGLSAMFATFFPFLYFILLEGFWNGQTIGKKATGLRVRMADGTPITFLAAFSRNLMRPADLLPGTYLVGIGAMFTNPRSQRVGDLIAGTVVCSEKMPTGSISITPHTAGIHPLESQIGDLKAMTTEEYFALRRFADRFPELSGTVQQRLTREVFLPIAERRNIPILPNMHPIYLAEAAVMKYGRQNGLL